MHMCDMIHTCVRENAFIRSVLQCVAVCCSTQIHDDSYTCARECMHTQCVAVCCSVLQCVAVCYSVLQCVAVCCGVCCSELQ